MAATGAVAAAAVGTVTMFLRMWLMLMLLDNDDRAHDS